MASFESNLTTKRVHGLIDVLGEEWVSSGIKEYEHFRLMHSPEGMWAHRHPHTPTVIPLLHSQFTPRPPRDLSLGHTAKYLEPSILLEHLVTAIYAFEGYWSTMPAKVFSHHLKTKLSTADQYSEFLHQLLMAADLKTRYPEHDLHLLFLDPETDRDGPQMTLRKGMENMDVHCKSTSALARSGLSFDLAQYVFGCFCRMVQDSRYSYRMALRLKQEPAPGEIDTVLDLLRPAIRGGWQLLKQTETPSFSIDLFKMDTLYEGLSLTEMNALLAKESGDLFVHIAGFTPQRERKPDRLAIFSISKGEYQPFESEIETMVSEAAESAKTPSIIACHLHRFIGWGEFLGNPTIRLSLRQKMEDMFSVYPNIVYVGIYSNRQELVALPCDAQRVDVQHLEIPNKSFRTPKPKLYMGHDSLAIHPEDT